MKAAAPPVAERRARIGLRSSRRLEPGARVSLSGLRAAAWLQPQILQTEDARFERCSSCWAPLTPSWKASTGTRTVTWRCTQLVLCYDDVLKSFRELKTPGGEWRETTFACSDGSSRPRCLLPGAPGPPPPCSCWSVSPSLPPRHRNIGMLLKQRLLFSSWFVMFCSVSQLLPLNLKNHVCSKVSNWSVICDSICFPNNIL